MYLELGTGGSSAEAVAGLKGKPPPPNTRSRWFPDDAVGKAGLGGDNTFVPRPEREFDDTIGVLFARDGARMTCNTSSRSE